MFPLSITGTQGWAYALSYDDADLPMTSVSDLRNTEILVTGGAGFIGSHLVDALMESGARVTILDDHSTGGPTFVNPKANLIRQDITQFEPLKNQVEGQDCVFHLAASATTRETSLGWEQPETDIKTNILGTQNILRAVAESNPEARLVFASSAAVYGNPVALPMDEGHRLQPISPYGISKLAGEHYCRAFCVQMSTDVVIARMFNVYGPRQTRYLMADVLRRIHQKRRPIKVLGTGQQIRDFVFVSDCISALLLLAEKGSAGECYNIGTGRGMTVSQVVERLLRLHNLSSDKLVRYTGRSWRGDIERLVADISKIKSLGYRPEVALERGLPLLNEWFKDGPS